MSWTTPRTWTASLVTVSDLNTHIRDNLNVLKTSINDNGTLKAAYPLKKGSGSSVATVATNVDTFAVSGLAVDDALEFLVTFSQITNSVSQVSIWSSTDSVAIARLNSGGSTVAGNAITAKALIFADQSASTQYNSTTIGASSGGGSVDEAKATTGLTAWTGSWTVALHFDSQSGAGTFRWRWIIYKRPGS